MPTTYYLVLSFALFLIGTSGVLLRRNALIVLMGIELQLNGGNLALIAFARQLGDLKGHVLAFLIIALAAAVAMTKKTAAWPCKKPPCMGELATRGKRENARKVRFTALSISSMLMRTMMALRRSTTPEAPSAKSSAASTR